jgi:hypothetical protein
MPPIFHDMKDNDDTEDTGDTDHRSRRSVVNLPLANKPVERLLAAGAFDVVMDALETHIARKRRALSDAAHLDQVQHCVAALRNFLEVTHDDFSVFEVLADQPRLAPLLTKALRQYPSDPRVVLDVFWCFTAVGALDIDYGERDGSVHSKNRMDADVSALCALCDAIMDTLRANRGDDQVVAFGAAALMNLGLDRLLFAHLKGRGCQALLHSLVGRGRDMVDDALMSY